MHEIICPHCHESFVISEADYAAILSQVRNDAFEEELAKRMKDREAALQSQMDVKLMQAKQTAATKSDKELQELRQKLADAEKKSTSLQAQLDFAADKHKTELKVLRAEQDVAVKDALRKGEQDALSESNKELESLRKQLLDSEKKSNALQTELDSVSEKHDSELKILKMEQAAAMKTALDYAESEHAREVKTLQEEVAHYKDFKARSSTKMVGESLEQHCMDEFDKLRATAFVGDYFEKDNEISESGSKGDFIYRAYDENGNELVSIMFEMKNEMEQTSTNQKHKNVDFFKELDKDRREKNCEYAVLCSLLESDSELYNQGIVDVSHRYPKMYVIRPQFFIVIITLLRNAARSQTALKNELAAAQRSNVDIINLEKQVDAFKTAFGKNYDLASRKFEETIAEIDKAIMHLQKTKDALTSCDRNLRLANDKSSNLTVKKLLKESPSILEQYNAGKQ